MKTKVVAKPLPASVPIAHIADSSTRASVMKLFECIRHLDSEIKMLCTAVVELQKKIGGM